MISLLSLLLATAEPIELLPVRPTASRDAVVSVTIIRAERVDVVNAPNAPQPDRQHRRRGAMPIVEFY